MGGSPPSSPRPKVKLTASVVTSSTTSIPETIVFTKLAKANDGKNDKTTASAIVDQKKSDGDQQKTKNKKTNSTTGELKGSRSFEILH